MVVVWDKESHIKEEEKQLGDEEIYEEVSNDVASLLKTINAVIAKKDNKWCKKEHLRFFVTKKARNPLSPT